MEKAFRKHFVLSACEYVKYKEEEIRALENKVEAYRRHCKLAICHSCDFPVEDPRYPRCWHCKKILFCPNCEDRAIVKHCSLHGVAFVCDEAKCKDCSRLMCSNTVECLAICDFCRQWVCKQCIWVLGYSLVCRSCMEKEEGRDSKWVQLNEPT